MWPGGYHSIGQRAPVRARHDARPMDTRGRTRLLSSTSSMMPQAARDPKRLALLVGLLIVAAVVFRSVFFLEFDESYFDSDQAIVGLMAKHLAEGRARPLFFYGQEYML